MLTRWPHGLLALLPAFVLGAAAARAGPRPRMLCFDVDAAEFAAAPDFATLVKSVQAYPRDHAACAGETAELYAAVIDSPAGVLLVLETDDGKRLDRRVPWLTRAEEALAVATDNRRGKLAVVLEGLIAEEGLCVDICTEVGQEPPASPTRRSWLRAARSRKASRRAVARPAPVRATAPPPIAAVAVAPEPQPQPPVPTVVTPAAPVAAAGWGAGFEASLGYRWSSPNLRGWEPTAGVQVGPLTAAVRLLLPSPWRVAAREVEVSAATVGVGYTYPLSLPPYGWAEVGGGGEAQRVSVRRVGLDGARPHPYWDGGLGARVASGLRIAALQVGVSLEGAFFPTAREVRIPERGGRLLSRYAVRAGFFVRVINEASRAHQ